MRLRTLYIREYRALKDLHINFITRSFDTSGQTVDSTSSTNGTASNQASGDVEDTYRNATTMERLPRLPIYMKTV